MAHWGCLQCPRTFSTDVDNGRFMAAFDTLLKIAPGFSYAVESPGAWVTGGAFLCESTQATCCSLSNGERRVRVVWADLARPGALGHRVHRRVHLVAASIYQFSSSGVAPSASRPLFSFQARPCCRCHCASSVCARSQRSRVHVGSTSFTPRNSSPRHPAWRSTCSARSTKRTSSDRET